MTKSNQDRSPKETIETEEQNSLAKYCEYFAYLEIKNQMLEKNKSDDKASEKMNFMITHQRDLAILQTSLTEYEFSFFYNKCTFYKKHFESNAKTLTRMSPAISSFEAIGNLAEDFQKVLERKFEIHKIIKKQRNRFNQDRWRCGSKF